MCPSHVTKKWVREIEETIPNANAKAAVVHNISEIDKAFEEYELGNKTMYLILSKERARDGYMKQPAAMFYGALSTSAI